MLQITRILTDFCFCFAHFSVKISVIRGKSKDASVQLVLQRDFCLLCHSEERSDEESSPRLDKKWRSFAPLWLLKITHLAKSRCSVRCGYSNRYVSSYGSGEGRYHKNS